MIEWDKLWKDYEEQWYEEPQGRATWLMKIRVEGDRLHNLNHRLAQSTIVYDQRAMISNQKLDKEMEKLAAIRKICNEANNPKYIISFDTLELALDNIQGVLGE